MADVTISNLPNLAVSSTNEIVHTDGNTTGKATVTALRAALNLPAAQVSSDWNAASGVAQILNKPSLGIGGMQAFTSSGTFTVPSNVTKLKLTVIGGGGGGGSCSSGTSCGGTGGQGGCSIGVVSVTPGSSYTATVGTGGGGGNRSPGGIGGTSSFTGNNITISATGGQGGRNQTGNGVGASGAPGSGSGGTVNISGVFFFGQGIGGGGGCCSANQSNGSAGGAGYILVEW